jgi:hypothetical protein
MFITKHLIAIAIIVSIASVPGWTQVTKHRPVPSAAANSATPKAMGNADIIALAAAGLSDDIIIAKIHTAPLTDFDTSVNGLESLKAANVSNAIIRVMIDPQAATATSTTAPTGSSTATANNPDDPLIPHSPGIYILAPERDRTVHLSKLEHTVPKQEKTSGTFLSGISYGIAKAHVKVVLDGANASVETSDSNPVFYVYIPEDSSTFGGNSITIKDFALVKFDVKSGHREVNTASVSMWGASAGTDEKARQGFSSDRVKPGIYKLTLLKPLPAGEYAFQQSGTQSSAPGQQNTGTYFAFGVNGAD